MRQKAITAQPSPPRPRTCIQPDRTASATPMAAGTRTAAVKGTVTVDPVEYGGDVKKRNISDAEWDIVGLPTFTPDTTTDSTEYPPAPTP